MGSPTTGNKTAKQESDNLALPERLPKRASTALEPSDKGRGQADAGLKLAVHVARPDAAIGPIGSFGRSQMRKRMIIMLILVAVVLGGVFGFQAFKGMMIKRFFATRTTPPQTVSTVEAKLDTWQPRIEAVGTLIALNGTDIAPELAGVVARIDFTSGQEIKAGTLLVELNTEADRAQLEVLKAGHALAQKTYARNVQLAALHIISPEDLDTAQANLDSTAAQVAAQTALIGKKLIRAPFAGRLGIRAVDLGEYVNPGTKLVNIQQLDPIFVDFYVAQKTLPEIAVGKAVVVHTDALPGQTFSGRVAAVDSTIDIGTRNVKVRAEMQNPKHRLLPGMFVVADIDVGQAQEQITLPQSAISYNPYGDIVYVVTAQGETPGAKPSLVAKQRFVTTGDTRGDQVAVIEGLKPGEVVVSSGQVKLHNDSPVVVNNSIQTADNPAPTPEDR